LDRFADSSGRVWALDKTTDTVFQTDPSNLAAERNFYDASELAGGETSPRFLEAQFADLEREAARITECWLRQVQGRDAVIVRDVNREIMSLFIATQLLRTVEFRKVLSEAVGPCIQAELANLHARLLCDDLTLEAAAWLATFIWIFGVNDSGAPFYTSDHPVALRSHSTHRCLHLGQFPQPDAEFSFPLSPTVILYGYEPTAFAKLKQFRDRVSPVLFTPSLVESDNIPQVGHASRFVFCNANSFDSARAICRRRPIIADPNRPRLVSR
jgi:hypothetical protein